MRVCECLCLFVCLFVCVCVCVCVSLCVDVQEGASSLIPVIIANLNIYANIDTYELSNRSLGLRVVD